MNTKGIVVTVVIVAIAVGVFIFVNGNNLNSSAPQPMTTTSPISSTSDWKTYTNSSYGYQVSYPQNAIVTKYYEEDRDPLEKTRYLQIFIPGSTTNINVQAYVSRTDVNAEEYNALVAKSLEQFASTLRQYQFNDQNPYLKNRQIGDLNHTTFAGQDAYSFTLTKGFTTTAEGGGYSIPEGITYTYIIFENKDKVKMLLSYPLNDTVAEKIKDSFLFVGG